MEKENSRDGWRRWKRGGLKRWFVCGSVCFLDDRIGNLALGCGELLNFCAFGFAPASLVVPLGGWSVAVAGFLAIK